MADLAELLTQLTLDEKVSLVAGESTWYTMPIERLGIGSLKLSDGPNGVRGDSGMGTPAICFPAAVNLSASFDREQVFRIGELLAVELQRKRAQVLLAPTLNIARHPLGGRNFESFGEDPTLVSTIGSAYIAGVQSTGEVAACAKHFVANDVEYRRFTVSSEIDDRTLREVYLRPFEAAVAADVWTIMAAYPRLNGVHCTEDRGLLTEILRDEWGWTGLVMSDWGATHDAAAPIAAGMDLEMPGPPLAFGDNLLRAIAAGEVAEADLDRRVTEVLRLAERTGRLGEGAAEDVTIEDSVDEPLERAAVRAVAADGMVLVHNDGTLPIDPAAVSTIAVIGPNATPGVAVGGGSAGVKPHHLSSPLEGLREVVGDGVEIRHEVGCLAHRYLPTVAADRWVGDDPISVEVFGDASLGGEVLDHWTQRSVAAVVHGPQDDLPDPMVWSRRYTGRLRVEVDGPHQFGVCGVGRTRVLIDGELVVDNWTAPQPGDVFYQFGTAEVTGSVDLTAGTEIEVVVEWSRGENPLLAGLRFGWLEPVDHDALLDAAVDAATAADVAVVVVGLNAEWETEGHDRPSYGLPGRQVELVERCLAANPRTVVVVNAGGPVDLPWLDTAAATVIAWYPGQEFGGALADVLTGRAEPGGRSPVTFPARLADAPTILDVPGDRNLTHYREGVFVGHRWYDARELDVAVPFGHGTSYTTFELGAAAGVLGADGAPTVTMPSVTVPSVTVPITNTGDRPGKAVVQAYVSMPDGAQRHPVRVLGGFAVARLAPGATEDLVIGLAPETLREWHTEANEWRDRPGAVTVELGWSSRDLVTSLEIDRT